MDASVTSYFANDFCPFRWFTPGGWVCRHCLFGGVPFWVSSRQLPWCSQLCQFVTFLCGVQLYSCCFVFRWRHQIPPPITKGVRSAAHVNIHCVVVPPPPTTPCLLTDFNNVGSPFQCHEAPPRRSPTITFRLGLAAGAPTQAPSTGPECPGSWVSADIVDERHACDNVLRCCQCSLQPHRCTAAREHADQG